MATFRTFTNRTIPVGENETPSAAIPSQYKRAELVMTRTNWPAAGVTITLWLSYDNEQTWVVANRAFIWPWVSDGKDLTNRPASIGMGWSTRQPTHAKVSADSPSSFTSTVTIQAF